MKNPSSPAVTGYFSYPATSPLAVGDRNVKTVTVVPAELSYHQARATGTMACTGLRRDSSTGNLRPVARPLCVVADGSTPLVVVDHAVAGSVAVFADGVQLSYAFVDRENAQRIPFAMLEAEASAAVAIDGGAVVLVTTGRGTREILIDRATGIPSLAGLPSYPAFRFAADSEMSMSEPIGERTLDISYSTRSMMLIDADREALTADALRAYSSLASLSAASGCFMQPLLARYRLVDRDGNTLFISNPALIGPSNGFQCCSAVEARLSSGLSVRESTALSAKVFRLKLIRSEAAAVNAGNVDRLIVETSLPIHPIDFDSAVANRIEKTGTDSALIRFMLPGVSVGMTPSPTLRGSLARRAIEHGDSVFSEAMVIRDPFGDTSQWEIPPTDTMCTDSAATQRRALRQIVKSDPPVADATMARCSVPHSFSGTSVALSGDTLLMGNLMLLRFKGYSPWCFTAATSDGEWTAAVAVEMASGDERVVAVDSGSDNAPALWGPLLYYPSPDAVSMTITVRSGDKAWRGRFPLSPTADGRGACYLHYTFAPFSITYAISQFVTPTAKPVVTRLRRTVATLRVDDFRNAVATASPSGSDIMAILPADRGESGLNHTCRSFYLFGSGDTHSLSVNPDRSVRSVDRLDWRGIRSAAAVTLTTDPQTPVIGILGNDIVSLRRRKISTIARGFGGQAIGWDPVDNELWITGDNGKTEIMTDWNGSFYSFTGLSPTGFLGTSRSLFIGSASGLRSTAAGREAMDTDISYSVAIAAPRDPHGRPLRAMRCRVAIAAGLASLNISVNGIRAPAVAEGLWRSLGSLAVEGTVNAPLTLGQIFAPPLSLIRLSVEGRLSPEAEIGETSIAFG